MSKKRLFVCEKSVQAKQISEHIEENDLIILSQTIAGFKFDYQSLSFSESPYFNEEPKYKQVINEYSEYFNTTTTNYLGESSEHPLLVDIYKLKIKETKQNNELKKLVDLFLNDFDEIIYACDPDHTGFRGFEFKFSKYFNLGENWYEYLRSKDIKIKAALFQSFSFDDIENAIKERKDIKTNPFIIKLKENYVKKDFFDYNYNLNSLLYFNNILKKHLDITEDNFPILTRNSISVFYFIIKDKLIEETQLFDYMRNYNIGSPVSYSVILSNLIKSKLIKKNNFVKHNYKNNKKTHIFYYEVSELGKIFNNYLTSELDNINLSNDIFVNNFGFDGRKSENHYALLVEDFKLKYEKYIYHVFSKQKDKIKHLVN